MAENFRHELKFTINAGDVLTLCSRLSACMARDCHNGGTYAIRSLYFDNLYDKALNEKLDGVDGREKFRIRCYNGEDALIRMEKKMKQNGLCRKLQAELSRADPRRGYGMDAGCGGAPAFAGVLLQAAQRAALPENARGLSTASLC